MAWKLDKILYWRSNLLEKMYCSRGEREREREREREISIPFLGLEISMKYHK